jgi:hypothetical protein
MSSWNNGRTQIRKMPKQIIPQVNIIEPNNKQESVLPSKYVFNRSITDAVICVIALNEEKYIDEWIKYHLSLGFQHIYIYDNSENYLLKNKSSSYVTVIHFPGHTKQLEAYDVFTRTYRKKHKWAAFIDCDEFIILKKHNNIIEFLNEYDKFSAVALNWLFFGTAHQLSYDDDPVTKRFQLCSKSLDLQIKCIVKINLIDRYISPHFPLLVNGTICNINKTIINGPFNEEYNSDIAYIHHYYTKSEQEFREKIERGRADISEKRKLDELIDIHNKNNDILNSDAWAFYSKHCLPS